jgi:hypothetical protein
MKLSLALSTLFSISAVSAAPSNLQNRVRARAVGPRAASTRGSQPLVKLAGTEFKETVNGTAHVSYSSNWSGAVLESPPSGTTFTSAHGRFTVPTPKHVGSGGSESSSAWVGIDGDTYGNAILQAGVDFTVSSSGAVTYDSWYEWYPDYAYDFSGISFKAGDTVTLTVTATSNKAGSAVITNVSTGKTVTKSLTSSAALCETIAVWIVEDFESNGSLVPFANFGKVTFTNAKATTSSGTVGPSGATIIDIQQNGQVLTSVSTTSSSVTVTYV